MSYDRSSVEAVVQHYFDALYEGDADKLGAIFHPTADLRWLEKGDLQILTVPIGSKASGSGHRRRPKTSRARILSSPSIARTRIPPSSRFAANCPRAISPIIWWR